MNHPRFLPQPSPAPRAQCRGFELDADGNPQTSISVAMGLNQPITARGGPLQEDGGGVGGLLPGGPAWPRGSSDPACPQKLSGGGNVSL